MSSATLLKQGARPADRPGEPLPRKPHICFVAPYLWPVLARDPDLKIIGGAEVQQTILARLFRRNGYRVSVVCNDYGQPDAAEIDGIAVHKTFRDTQGIPVLRFVHPRLTAVWRALRAADADIYYQRSADLLTGVVARFCRRHGKRSIYAGASDRDFERGRQQIRFARDRWIFEYGMRHVDRIVAQNPAQLKACREQYGRDAVLIPSCYELPEESRPAYGDCVLWVATVHEYKRPEMALAVARRLPQRRFVMVGGRSTGARLKPGYYEAIRDAAARLPNVEFKGFLPLAEVETCFDGARILLNTSVYEGVPNTFMQAWARGIPTVATVDIGAQLDGEEVYKKTSSVAETAAEIERLFEDRLHWARASARCRAYFTGCHSSAEALARYERIFRELQAVGHR
jgi:glycosyltransferase involved in cell wall biosynthesis